MAANEEKRNVTIFINGQEVNNTLKSITAEAAKLRNQLANTTVGTAEYNAALTELGKVNTHIADIQRDLQGVSVAQAKLDAETKEARTGISKYFGDWKDGFAELKEFAEKVTIGTLISKGVSGIVDGIGEIFSTSQKEFEDAEKTQAQLAAVLKSTGGAAGISMDQLQKYQQTLMAQTGIDDDVIAKGEEMLLTFTNVGGKIYEKALPAIVDMTSAMNQGNVSMESIQATSIQVGKALNDPINGMASLRKVGVTFNDQQKEQIKTMQQSGDLMGAQTIILQELQKEFGGVAAAMQNTDTGKLQAWDTLIGNLKEKVGALIVEAKVFIAEALTPLVTWISNSDSTIVNFIKAIVVGTTAFVTYKVAVVAASIANKAWLTTVVESETFTKLAIAAETSWATIKLILTGRIKEARAEMAAFNALMETSPWGLVIAGITAAVVAYQLYNKQITAAEKTQQAVNDVKATAAKQIVDETSQIQQLEKVINSETASRQLKLKVVNDLRAISPEILKNLSDEEALTAKGTKAIDSYISALTRKATAEAVTEKIKELKKQNVDLDTKPLSNDDISLGQDFGAFFTAGTHDQYVKNKEAKALKNREKLKKEHDDQAKSLMVQYQDVLNPKVPEDSSTPVRSLNSMNDALQKLNARFKEAEAGSKNYYDLREKIKAQENEIAKFDLKDQDKTAKTGESAAKKAAKIDDERNEARLKSLADQAAAISDAYGKEIILVDEHYRELIHKNKDNAATVQQLEKERLSKLGELRDKYNLEDAAKLDKINKEILKVAADSIQDGTEKALAELKAGTEAKIAELDKEEVETNKRISKQQVDVANLKKQGKEVEAQILENSIAHELDQLDASGKLRIAFLKLQAQKEQDIKTAAANAVTNDQDAADVTNAGNVKDPAGILKSPLDAQQKAEQKQLDDKHQQDVANANKEGKTTFDIEAKYAKAKYNLKKSYADKEHQIDDNRIAFVSTITASLMGLVGKQTVAYKLFSIAHKAAAIGQVVMDTKKEIQGYWASYADIPFVGPIIAGGLTAAAVVRSADSINTIRKSDAGTPGYETGGYSAIDYTQPQGFVSRPTLFANSSARPFVAGEGNKTEYIISSEQLRDPVIADFAAAMEANRGVRRFENGGYSNARLKSESTSSTPAPVFQNNNDDIVNELRILRQSIKDQKVVLSRRLEEKEGAKIVQIRNNSNA